MLAKAYNLNRFSNLFKALSITATTQITIQLISLTSGIMVIRSLSITEYALYTLANNMLGAMNILSNGGIVSGVISEGGKVWDDRNKLGAVVATGLDLRKRFAIISIIIIEAILLYLLKKNEATWLESILICLSLMPAYISNLSGSMYEIAPKLNQDLYPLQKNQLIANIGRLLMLTISITFFPFTAIALLSDGIPKIITNIRLKAISEKFANVYNNKDKEIKRRILSNVKRVLPSDIYNIFSAQITVWILTIFGSTSAIAQVGALYRIASVLTLFNVVFNTIIIPRYSRLKEDKTILIEKLLNIIFVLLIVCSTLIFIIYLFSKQVTWILGNNYKGLETEITLVMILFSINFFSNSVNTLCISRSWAINPLLIIIINIISILIGIYIFNPSTLYQTLIFNIFVSSVMALINILFAFRRVYIL
ncbi:MATE family efflux transporter [Telluribacter humicola]|uniref:polysaccharide biosynthesis protein n=1 Tax=Telluribacter humicola TaxID=1720261 RepID=UPI001A9614BC|nr:polysaccharide biosynthesis protein [Telluribacter humicola]